MGEIVKKFFKRRKEPMEECWHCKRAKKIKWESLSDSDIIFCSKRCLYKWLSEP